MIRINAEHMTPEEVIEFITWLEGNVTVETKEWIYTVYAEEREHAD